MKRLMVLSVAAVVFSTASIANAGFMYYLKPMGGTGSPTAADSPTDYVVNSDTSVTIYGSQAQVQMVLYAAIPGSVQTAALWGLQQDTLSVTNVPTSASPLIGTFLATGTPYNDVVGGPTGPTGQNAVTLAAAASNSPGYSGGYLGTVSGGSLSGLGTIGLAGTNYNMTAGTVGGTEGPTGNGTGWYSFITMASPPARTNAGSVAETASDPMGVGYWDIPLGTMTYSLAASPGTALANGESAKVGALQVGNYNGVTTSFKGSYKSNGATTSNATAFADTPITLTYSNGTLPTDTSVVTLSAATLDLGNVLKGAVVFASGGSLNVASTDASNATLTGTANLASVPTTTTWTLGSKSLGATPGLGITLNAANYGTSGGTLTVANLGNTADTGGIKSMAVTANVGVGTAGAAGAYGITLSGAVAAGSTGPLAAKLPTGVGGSAWASSANWAGSEAIIEEGSGLTGLVSLKWRNPTTVDLQKLPAGNTFVASDVANIGGITAATPFALQMNYDPALFGDQSGAAAGASGHLFLGYFDTTAQQWKAAGTAASGLPESWSAFRQANPGTLASLVGDWGYDTSASGHTVWAVLGALPNGGAATDFIAVPEPGTLTLLAAGLAAGLLFIRRKRTTDVSV